MGSYTWYLEERTQTGRPPWRHSGAGPGTWSGGRGRSTGRGTRERSAALVTRVAERGERLKAVGSGLSWSDINEVEGQHLLLLDRMNAVGVDGDAKTVTVQGGAVMADINVALAAKGLAFDNIGSIVTQTAAGYTGTGTHGSGTPLLSTFIETMRLVDGQGHVRELSIESEPELFSAARVHLGCLGVVTEITFRCVEAFDLEERREIAPFWPLPEPCHRWLQW